MRSTEISEIFRRICEELGIAFSANKVAPILADLGLDVQDVERIEEFNAVGKHFGIRFREFSGQIKELIATVSETGPVMVELDDSARSAVVVLKALSKGRVLIHFNGEDQTVSSRWLRQRVQKNEDGQLEWLLIRPMFASGNASRVHYTGDTSEPLTPLKRFIRILKPDGGDIRTILIFSIVVGLLSLTTPLAVEAVVNTLAFGRYLQPLFILCLIVLVFLVFRAVLTVLLTVISEIIQRRLFLRTVEDLSYRLTRVPLSVWNKYHGPELVNRFFDVVNLQKITSKLLLDTLSLFLQTIIGLSVLAFYHPFLLGYDIGLLTMITIVLWFIGRGAVRTAKEESQLKYDTAAWLQEIVRHPSTFKYNGGLGFAINRADELGADYIYKRQSHFRILIKQISFTMLMQVLAATALLALGGYLVIEQQLTLGQLVAAELIVTVLLGNFAKIGKDLESFYDLMASVDKLGKLFDLPIERSDKLQLVKQPGAYRISLENFSLTGTGPTCNLEFRPALSFAILGGTEANRGKLINTMIGQNEPAQGYVLLNEYRVDSLSSESLQAKIGVVRDIELFEGTIDDNLRLGREDVGSAEAVNVIRRLGLRETMAAMEKGLNTVIRINGYPLSRGQAIRLVLARALISKPGVLFIDGLLDFLSDDDLQDVLPRLESFQIDTTLIVSTGRRAVIEWANHSLDLGNQNWEFVKSSSNS